MRCTSRPTVYNMRCMCTVHNAVVPVSRGPSIERLFMLRDHQHLPLRLAPYHKCLPKPETTLYSYISPLQPDRKSCQHCYGVRPLKNLAACLWPRPLGPNFPLCNGSVRDQAAWVSEDSSQPDWRLRSVRINLLPFIEQLFLQTKYWLRKEILWPRDSAHAAR